MVPVPVRKHSTGSTRSWRQAGPDGRGGVPLVPCVAEAQQGLQCSGLGGRGGSVSCGTSSRLGSGAEWWRGSQWSWIWRHDRGVTILVLCGSVGWRPARLRDGYPTVCGSGTQLWPGAALWTYRTGIWQAGCSFIRSWCGEAFHDLNL
jgi:hypothetical protein